MKNGPTDTVADWLLCQARELASSREVVGELCRRLVDDGMVLHRLFVSARTLHPLMAAIGLHWSRRDNFVKAMPRDYSIFEQDIYLNSPVRLIHGGAQEVRRRVGPTGTPQEFPVLEDLAKEGATEYLALPMRFSGGRINAVSIATDATHGFAPGDVERFKSLVPLLGLVLEIKETRHMAATLLDTYLGRDAGRRVLSGLIKRGDGVTIAAALWYCDLRGFTGMTEHMPRDAVITMLNDYFGCMVEAVRNQGGDVLKFIGDAMLAIFPIADDLDRDRACLTALAAAEEALASLEKLNSARRAAGQPVLGVGIALHTGAVMYGNIGGPDRLDFTVIGPAVNLVTRLEQMCAELGRPLLASARFASPCGSRLVPVGRSRLRGIAAEQEIFGLPNEPH
ncbi:MAG: adenylate/guanylate cyclase domain-containing protein [Dongiaceae bacterium]